jgi:hypothetical protein
VVTGKHKRTSRLKETRSIPIVFTFVSEPVGRSTPPTVGTPHTVGKEALIGSQLAGGLCGVVRYLLQTSISTKNCHI